MGTDMVSYVEVRDAGGWQKLGKVIPLNEEEREFYGRDFTEEPFWGRRYGLFAWLADVRNYRGQNERSPHRIAPMRAPRAQ